MTDTDTDTETVDMEEKEQQQEQEMESPVETNGGVDAEEFWSDIDPEAEGSASDEWEQKELADGRPVIVKEVKEGELQSYRQEVQARNDDIGEERLTRKVLVKVLQDHYKTPDFSYLTPGEIEQSKMGYYDQFVDPIAPELANQQNL